jgi:hypothetical protein
MTGIFPRLFETEKTFRYLLKMQFEEIKGEDTLKLPNFGIDPKPELRKGKDKYSCVIGFIDRTINSANINWYMKDEVN